MKLIITFSPDFSWGTVIFAGIGLAIIASVDWRIAIGVFLTHLKFSR